MSILSARKQAGLTQADIAEALDVTVAAVSAWENGKAYPTVERLIALAKMCNCSTDDLVREDT